MENLSLPSDVIEAKAVDLANCLAGALILIIIQTNQSQTGRCWRPWMGQLEECTVGKQPVKLTQRSTTTKDNFQKQNSEQT